MAGKTLVQYSSSEESNDDEETVNKTGAAAKSLSSHQRLPLPDNISTLFSDRKNVDNPEQHGGRIRSFPHMEGNWATIVYGEYEPEEEFFELQSELFKCLRPLEFQQMENYHVSLSRTVVVRHHWIKDLTDTLQEQFAAMPQCACEVDGVSVLTNDEKTRSFLVLNVSTADNQLESYVSVVDRCFQQYNLQEYYKPPLFHISIGWCLEDVSHIVTSKVKAKLQKTLQTAIQEDSDLRYFCIDRLTMKTGNKLFSFQLNQQSNSSVSSVT